MSERDDIHRWFGVFEGVVSVTNGMLCRFMTQQFMCIFGWAFLRAQDPNNYFLCWSSAV